MKVCYIYAAALSAISTVYAQTTTDTTAESSTTTATSITPDATVPAEATDASTASTASDPSNTDALGSTTSTSASLDTTVIEVTITITSIADIATTITSTDSAGDTILVTTSFGSINTDIVTTNITSTRNVTDVTTTTSSSTRKTTTTSSAKPVTLPTSTDAASYLSFAFPAAAPQPTWATGQYYTMLASALYSVDRSFVQRSDYQTIISAIESAADNAGNEVSSSVEASAWGWGMVTTNSWYQSQVPAALQTEVLNYNSAWHSAASSVQALATAAQPSSTAAAAPRCTGVVFAGIAAGVAGMVIGTG